MLRTPCFLQTGYSTCRFNVGCTPNQWGVRSKRGKHGSIPSQGTNLTSQKYFISHNKGIAPNFCFHLIQAKSLITEFEKCEVKHVPGSKNKQADALSKLAANTPDHMSQEVKLEILNTPSTAEAEVCAISMSTESWMTPIMNYILNDALPPDKAQARKIKVKSLQYQVIDGTLYRKTFLGPLLRCLEAEQAKYVIKEIHWGICGIHAGPRMVVTKAMNAGYFWPGMHQDAVHELQKCESCQRHAPISLRAKNKLVLVTSAWPFQKWGIDIVGPFPTSSGQAKFLLVAVDYFTKWVEAKPLAKISGAEVKKFVWENIVCRFGLPMVIISDNGKQFAHNPFKKWCSSLGIEQAFSSVAHPQANGQVERVNRSLVEGIKKRLGKKRSGWVDELPNVLSAYRTMNKTSTGETPFSLTYGTEAMIPVEIGIPTYRVANPQENENELRNNLDLLEERRETAAIKEAKYKRTLEKYYNSRVREQRFKVGEYVMRSNEASGSEKPGKMSPTWEGPYVITSVGDKGAYRLATLDGEEIPRTWNGVHLKKCYI